MSAGGRAARMMVGCLFLLAAASCVVSVGSVPAVSAAASDESKKGAVLFHERGCEHCHGVEGVGTERGPNLTGVGRLLHKPDIERQIREGGKEMPAFGDALSNDEVQQMVAYLATKKKKGTKLSAWSASRPKAS